MANDLAAGYLGGVRSGLRDLPAATEAARRRAWARDEAWSRTPSIDRSAATPTDLPLEAGSGPTGPEFERAPAPSAWESRTSGPTAGGFASGVRSPVVHAPLPGDPAAPSEVALAPPAAPWRPGWGTALLVGLVALGVLGGSRRANPHPKGHVPGSGRYWSPALYVKATRARRPRLRRALTRLGATRLGGVSRRPLWPRRTS